MRHLVKIALALTASVSLFGNHSLRAQEELQQGQSAEADVTVQWNVMIPMRDGVRLATDIFRPAKPGKYPVILTRDIYGNGFDQDTLNEGMRWAKRGYVYVHQDIRGRYDSEGTPDVYVADIEDGYDTQVWAGAQPWSSGKVGMIGMSYLGGVQWLSAAEGAPPLVALMPQMTAFNWYQDAMYPGGAFSLGSRVLYSSLVSGRTNQFLPLPWPKIFRHLPLSTVDQDMMGQDLQALRTWIAHPSFDSYWQRLNTEDKVDKIDLPAFHIGGWYDQFQQGTLSGFVAMRRGAPTAQARASQKLIMGPWPHKFRPITRLGDLDFGPDSVVDLERIQVRWMDHWLKGEQNGIMEEPPVRLFVMGENKWRSEQEWPLARTKYTRFYIDRAGSSGSADDGVLREQRPSKSKAADHYIYDPADPVPTAGGNNIVPEFGGWGPVDQSGIEARSDVLVFSTPVLDRDVEVTGPVTATLFASSSAVDTDFTVKLTDVHPGGKSYNLADGIIRARYRDGFSKPGLMTPGKIYEFHVVLGSTSNLFKKGHRIRVAISSSNFPRYDRNPNTDAEFGTNKDVIKATQTIYRSEQYPSHITLPIIPR